MAAAPQRMVVARRPDWVLVTEVCEMAAQSAIETPDTPWQTAQIAV